MAKSAKMELAGNVSILKETGEALGGDKIGLLEKIAEYGSITRAAKAVGLSYKTAWDYVKFMNNVSARPLVVRTAGGKGGGGTVLTDAGKEVIEHYRIIRQEHRKFLDNLAEKLGNYDTWYQFLRRISMKVSARNVFVGTVSRVKKGAVNAEVDLTLKGGDTIAAIITNDSVDNLGLAEGSEAYAIVKASWIILGTDLHGAKISTRNILCGTVTRVAEGAVNSEIDLKLAGGNTVSAIITKESAAALGLKEGVHACAAFKASSVIIGVE